MSDSSKFLVCANLILKLKNRLLSEENGVGSSWSTGELKLELEEVKERRWMRVEMVLWKSELTKSRRGERLEIQSQL